MGKFSRHYWHTFSYARENKDKTEYWESVASQLCSTSLFLKYNRVSGPNIKAKFMQIVNTQNDRSSAYFKALQNEVSFEIWMKVKKEYFDHIQSVELKKVAALKKKADADITCLTHEAANTSSTSMDAAKLLKQNSKKRLKLLLIVIAMMTKKIALLRKTKQIEERALKIPWTI